MLFNSGEYKNDFNDKESTNDDLKWIIMIYTWKRFAGINNKNKLFCN